MASTPKFSSVLLRYLDWEDVNAPVDRGGLRSFRDHHDHHHTFAEDVGVTSFMSNFVIFQRHSSPNNVFG